MRAILTKKREELLAEYWVRWIQEDCYKRSCHLPLNSNIRCKLSLSGLADVGTLRGLMERGQLRRLVGVGDATSELLEEFLIAPMLIGELSPSLKLHIAMEIERCIGKNKIYHHWTKGVPNFIMELNVLREEMRSKYSEKGPVMPAIDNILNKVVDLYHKHS